MNKILKKFNKKFQNGFTIVETLVAIAILMISIAGPMTVAQKSLNAAIFAKDQVTASFLAQDAMEFIKNHRDANSSDFGTWYTLYDLCSDVDHLCSIDTTSTVHSISTISCGSTCPINVGSNGEYGSGGSPSRFTRGFYMSVPSTNAGQEVRVVVIVGWKSGNITNSLTLEDEMFDIHL